MIVNWSTGHGTNGDGVWWFGYSFLADMIEARLPWNNINTDNQTPLNNINIETGWLADHKSWDTMTQIYPYADFPSDKDPLQTSWLPNSKIAHAYIAASSYKYSETTTQYFENKVRITGDARNLPRLEEGDEYLLTVWNNDIENPDSVFLYDGDILIAKGKTDSLNFTDHPAAGWHQYWGIIKDAEGRQLPGTTHMIWVHGFNFNPGNLPVFVLDGHVAFQENKDTMVCFIPEKANSVRECYFRIEPDTCSVAGMDFDSLTGKVTFLNEYNKFGSDSFYISCIDRDNPELVYERFFTLSVYSNIPKFEPLSEIHIFEDDDTVVTKRLINRLPLHSIDYTIDDEGLDFITSEVNEDKQSFSVSPVPGQKGFGFLKIQAYNLENLAHVYTDSVMVGVFNDIRFQVDTNILVALKNKPNRDTLDIIPYNSKYDVSYSMPYSNYINTSLVNEENGRIYYLLEGVHPGTSTITLTATEKENSLNTYFKNINFEVKEISTGIYSGTDALPPVKIYPNPAEGVLIIKNVHFNTPFQVRLYNIHGKCMKEISNQSVIDISEFKPGIIFVNVTSAKQYTKSFKIMIK
jgi:hypothetical protein